MPCTLYESINISAHEPQWPFPTGEASGRSVARAIRLRIPVSQVCAVALSDDLAGGEGSDERCRDRIGIVQAPRGAAGVMEEGPIRRRSVGRAERGVEGMLCGTDLLPSAVRLGHFPSDGYGIIAIYLSRDGVVAVRRREVDCRGAVSDGHVVGNPSQIARAHGRGGANVNVLVFGGITRNSQDGGEANDGVLRVTNGRLVVLSPARLPLVVEGTDGVAVDGVAIQKSNGLDGEERPVADTKIDRERLGGGWR